MTDAAQVGPSVRRVTRWIEHDIADRGLRVGDSYLTAAQMAQMLSVSRATADRAMRQLAHCRVLTRCQRSGTFIGPGQGAPASPTRPLDVVHVLLSSDYVRAGLIAADVLADTLSTTLDGAAVDMHFIPEADSYDYVSRVLQRIRAERDANEGILMIRASREAQMLAEASKIPTVVHGSVYPGVHRLPWLDVDQTHAGHVAARFALETGCRRFALLTRDQWRRGDNLLLEGVTRELAGAGVKLDELNIVSMPQAESVIERQVAATLRGAAGRVALICRNAVFAECAMRAAEAGGFNLGRDFQVISTQAAPGRTAYAHVSPALDIEAQLRWLGEQLAEFASGAMLLRDSEGGGGEEAAHKLIPAVLVPGQPEEANGVAGTPGRGEEEQEEDGGAGGVCRESP